MTTSIDNSSDELDKMLELLYNSAWVEGSNWEENNPEHDPIPSKREIQKIAQARQAIDQYVATKVLEELQTLMQGHTQPYAAGNAEIILNAVHDRIEQLSQLKEGSK